MKPTIRITSVFLAFCMLFAFFSMPQADAAGTATYQGKSYSTDYTTWRQGDPAWGTTALGDLHTFGGSGCLISAISIIMCHSGAYNPAQLNPGLFRDWLDGKGLISHSSDRSKDALLSFGGMTKYLSPRFYFVNQTFFSVSTPMETVCTQIADLHAQGYYVVARVKNSGHFVAVASVKNGNDAIIYDSGYISKQLLSGYTGTIGGLIWFKADLSAKDTILPLYEGPPAPSVTPLADVYGDSDRITLSWSPTNFTTHYNIYVDAKNANGTWRKDYRYHFYATSPFSLDALPPGTYRVKVQSTNASNWLYADSDYQTFTVKQGYLTVNYHANGGTVSPGSQLFRQGSGYGTLPTPKKSGAAFLGWYTSDGKMVTNTSKLASNKGHTLTARWTTEGVGFSKTKTYQNNFWDVSSSDWYHDPVVLAYSYGLMDGMEPKKFLPKYQVTASQAITLAARLRKTFLVGSAAFSSGNPWYKPYADYALSQKIVTTLPGDMNAFLTRQEFAAIITNALPTAALPTVNTVASGILPDVYKSDVGIYRLYRAGILAGRDGKGTFSPNDPISRAEVATVLVRLVDPNARLLFTLT